MNRWVLAAAIALLGCEPRLPTDRSGLDVRIVGGDGAVDPGVVFVRFDPPAGDREAWAVRVGDGLPARRTIWTGLSGDVDVVAAGFSCPDGCGEVDPFSDPPVGIGRTATTLRAGRTTSVTVELVPVQCGNGSIEQGEACDGGPHCSDECTMGVVEHGPVPGIEDAGLEVVCSQDDLVIAWIDGSCGSGDCTCLSWQRWLASGHQPPEDAAGSRTKDGTDCGLASDHESLVAWFDGGTPASLLALETRSMTGEADLGEVDLGAQIDPAVGHTPGASLGLAVHPGGGLELRWPSGSTGAGTLAAGSTVRSPGLAVTRGDGVSAVAALWMVEAPDGTQTWHLRRWTWEDGAVEPVPLETASVPLDLGGPAQDHRILASPRQGRLVIVSTQDGDLTMREFAFADLPPADPDGVAAGEASPGVLLSGAAAAAGVGVLALVTVPLSGSPTCVTRLLAFDPEAGWRARLVRAWGSEGGLGCRSSLAILPPLRFVVAWRVRAGTPSSVLVQWTLGTVLPSF